MDREQAIKIIKDCKEKSFKRTLYTLDEYYEAVNMAIQALEQTRWIPVSEKFPEESGEYLISINGGVTTSWFYRADGVWSYRNADITAWMPLPPSYEPQESEESE